MDICDDLAVRAAHHPGTTGTSRSSFDRRLAVVFGADLDTQSGSLVLLAGVAMLGLGLLAVSGSARWGFTFSGMLDGIESQLSVTGPAAVLVLAAAALNVLVGAVGLRLLTDRPYRDLSDLALSGFAGAVTLDAAALFGLGWAGLFGWPELILLHAAVLGFWFVAGAPRLLTRPVRIHFRRPIAWWPLVLLVWAYPLVVQLASPTAPFQDILPNHVAPVEHVRIFGSFATLTTSPSPIYGPSRLMLGYVALLGELTSITRLDAVLADAAFALPLTVLMVLAMRRLATELFGGTAGFWILLTFPLTFTFMRLPDTRGTVVAFPLAALALATVAAQIRENRNATSAASATIPREAEEPPREAARPGRPHVTLALAMSGAVMVHPLIGLVTFAAVAGALVLYPGRLARPLIPALVSGGLMAVPQLLTMGAIEAPSWLGLLFMIVGTSAVFASAFVVGRTAGPAGQWLDARLPGVMLTGLPGLTASQPGQTLARIGVVGVGIIGLLYLDLAGAGPGASLTEELATDFPRLAILSLLGLGLAVWSFAVLPRPAAGWVVLGCGIGAGIAAWTAADLVGRATLTQQAIHYEVPKTIEYWLPVMLALGAAGAIASIWRLRNLGPLRAVALLGLLAVTVFPVTAPLSVGPLPLGPMEPLVDAPFVQDVRIGEHRAAESLGLALREAERGYWAGPGYPDARLIIDGPAREVVAEIRSLEDDGRIGASTVVLHVAASFQQWNSVPIGVFTGAIETSISLQPEVSIHTEGGRLLGFDSLPAQLAAHPGIVVLEPRGLPGPTLAQAESLIASTGYHQIWSNDRARVYALT